LAAEAGEAGQAAHEADEAGTRSHGADLRYVTPSVKTRVVTAAVKGALRSQISHAYSHGVDLGDVDGARSLPRWWLRSFTSPGFKSTVADCNAGQLAPASLSMHVLWLLAHK
jgi:hypothetical protein